MRLSDELIDRIRNQANIKEVVGQYVDLQKSGRNHFAHCPFHEDNTPSLSVSEQKQIDKCFSCKRGGNVFGFIQEIENISFVESVFKVAEMANVPINDQLKHQVLNQGTTQDSLTYKLTAIHEKVAEFYHHLLMSGQGGSDAYDYLTQERGMSRELLEEFHIGYSPKQRDYTQIMLEGNDELELSDDLLAQSGLFSERHHPDDAFKDRFANRIMFPIRNHSGHTIGFSGRVFQDSPAAQNRAKYLNSPETKLFNKRKILFNYDKAKSTIRQTKEVVLFEGFMDVISAWEAGIKNGVASMGTALTAEHLQVISQLADTIVIAYDGDEAGRESTKRLIDFITQKSELTIEVASFPNGLDPDEFIHDRGSEAFVNFIQNGRDSHFAFLMTYWRQDYNLNNESERVKYVQQMATELAKLDSPIERDVYIKELAEEFNIAYESIDRQVQSSTVQQHQKRIRDLAQQRNFPTPEPPASYQSYAQTPPKTQVERAEENLLNRLFYHDHAWLLLNELTDDFSFAHAHYQRLFILYEDFRADEKPLESFVDYLSDSRLKNIVSDIMWQELSEEPTKQEMADYIHMIQEVYPLQQKIKDKQEALKMAQKQGDANKELSLTIEMINLNRTLKNLNYSGGN